MKQTDERETDELLISMGGSVKALSGGKTLGGYAVVFGGQDLVKDRFLPSTDFDLYEGKSVQVLFEHGLDPVIKKRRFGRATLKADKIGLWFESVLVKNGFEQKILDLVKAGKLFLSTGSAGHLIERKSSGEVNEILSWPVAEVSYTARPCDTRAKIMSLKSYLAGHDGAARLPDVRTMRENHQRQAEVAFLHAQQTIREGELILGPPYPKLAKKT